MARFGGYFRKKIDSAVRESNDNEVIKKELGMAREALKEEDFSDRQKLLQQSEISLVLDCYDDIFSDFDPRPYRNRAISHDLLAELERATTEKTEGDVEIHFLIPLEKRKVDKEDIIKRRLKDHFKKHHAIVMQEARSEKKQGLFMIVLGILLSIFAAIYFLPNMEQNLFQKVMLVLLEPAAWFLIWEGANRIIDTIEDYKAELSFNEKLANANIVFTPY